MTNNIHETMTQIFERATHKDIENVDVITVRTSENGLIKFDVFAHVFYTDGIITKGIFEDFENAVKMFIHYRKNILEKNFRIDTKHYSSYEDYHRTKKEEEFFHNCKDFDNYVNGLKISNYSEDDFFQTFITVSILDYIELGDEFSKKYEKINHDLSIEIVEDLETNSIEVHGNITFDNEIIETEKIEFDVIKMGITANKIKKIIKEKIEELVESED